MEHHEGVYEQVIEVNNTTQAGNEFLSQHIVQEIVVQNDNNQGLMQNCEMSGIEIILPSDCINIQDQCNSNIIICNTDIVGHEKPIENAILQHESNKDQSISQGNSVEGNITSCSESFHEQKVEEFIIQNQTPYQENFNVNNSEFVAKPENGNKGVISEVYLSTSDLISLMNENISAYVSTDNQPVNNTNTLNNSQNVADDITDIKEKNIKESEQVLENTFPKESCPETSIISAQTESSTTVKIETAPSLNEIISEAVSTVQESQSQSENHCSKEKQEKEKTSSSSGSNVNSNKEDVHSIPLPDEKEKVICSENVPETIVESANVTQSDDVAVLSEFGTMEYDMQEEDEKMEINSSANKSEIKESLETVNEKSAVEDQKTEDSKVPADENETVEQIKPEIKSNNVSINELENHEEDELDLHLSADQSTENHRKVIQDIFDDWQDENVEEEVAQPSSVDQLSKEPQDSVEMELQNLLNEEAQHEVIPSVNATENSLNSLENLKSNEQGEKISSTKVKAMKVEKSPSKSPMKSPKSTLNSTSAKDHGQSPKLPSSSQSDSRQKLQSPRPGVKVPGLHLTSQIASPAEVHEVLKERLREKQKDMTPPKTADVVFVKKLSQRLSNQLAGGTAVPPLIPLPQSVQGEHNESEKIKSTTETSSSSSTEQNKTSTDNKELLAILEGDDVDLDWSNLKPHGGLEESNKTTDSHNMSAKLDPDTERALALKQLLELPSIPAKKNNSGKQPKQNKKTGKSSKDTELKRAEDSDTSKDIINVPSSEDDSSPKKDNKTPKQQKENSQNARNSEVMELSVEESRSGRKRKLTEKAREHELTVKRQKVVKGKTVTESKKTSPETPEVEKQKTDTSSTTYKAETPKTSPKAETPKAAPKTETSKAARESSPPAASKSDSKPKKSEAKQQPQETPTKTPSSMKGKMHIRRNTGGVLKKGVPISKRKLAVKNLLRQKKVATSAKTVTTTPSSKSGTEKPISAAPKAKKVTEIDRLLQDEGVVNLLYDVEQPDLRKRLVPITKSHKKVMDMDKAERELDIRKKLVKNAVLRLRNPGSSAMKVSPRSRRNATVSASAEQSPAQTEKKTIESKESVPLDFIIPAKIRNAADASRIIRRHSSSSFSSTSASPRVSIDQPLDSIKLEEPEVQTKSKRKLSQDSNDKSDVAKRGRKKSIPKSEPETKDASEKSPAKKEQVKKVTTRSNVATPPTAAATKIVPKNKKVTKSKASVESSPADVKSPPKSQDELSACLAEAASALLSSINNTSRSSGGTANRKKGSTNVTKTSEDEKVDTKKLFSNKEVSVRYHGHLVQLILTPSTPVSGIRNAITIQVMNELREALSILKKDDDCRVVLFTSTGTSFCEGLELSSLLHSNKEERKTRAEEMANTVKEFIRCLASFNKPIVAGVQGAAIGLGVTMLPLFDLVIASDKATFSTPYGKLGQIAEGAAVLTLSHSLGSAVTNELLLGGRVLTASEALRAGLVTRVLWPDRFQGELLPSLKTMSEQSSQSMEATKALLRHSLRQKLDVSLESETYLLVQHWCSSECQEAIKVYIDEKGQ